jgi:coatomer subunit gamma
LLRKLTLATPTIKAPSSGSKAANKAAESATNSAAAAQKYAQELQKIPELAAYGGVLKSSPVVELTESETEYVVKAIKHVFKEHVVLQFVSLSNPKISISNTIILGCHEYATRNGID